MKVDLCLSLQNNTKIAYLTSVNSIRNKIKNLKSIFDFCVLYEL
jgi:hypothetical protein